MFAGMWKCTYPVSGPPNTAPRPPQSDPFEVSEHEGNYFTMTYYIIFNKNKYACM